MNTDFVVDISDRATDNLLVLFNTDAGREHLRDRMGVPEAVIDNLCSFGFSSICNVLAAIKVARQQRLGPRDVLATVATDGADMYASEVDRIVARDHRGGFDAAAAGEVRAAYLDAVDTADMLECTHEDRLRMFNLGYYTWVEQQGVPLEEFEARRSQDFWTEMRQIVHEWDAMIDEFNAGSLRDGDRRAVRGAVAGGHPAALHGLRAEVPAEQPFAWRCPAARPGDDIDHVLRRVLDPAGVDGRPRRAANPFVRYRRRFHAWHVARAAGWSDERFVDLVRELDEAIADVDGHGFRTTPIVRSTSLDDELGFAAGRRRLGQG